MDSTNERDGPDEGQSRETGSGGESQIPDRDTGSNNGVSAERTEAPPRPESGSGNSGHRRDFGLFDRLMDGVMGINRGSSRTAPLRSDGSSTTLGGSAQGESAAQGSNSRGSEATATFPNLENGGAIIITINYVFSDENDPSNPNRSGSLVMTLPNNASNREPRVIQEFIRLATQMAYSTIVNGIRKDNGISLEKFNSFPSKGLQELSVESRNCSICFEKFEEFNNGKKRKSLASDDQNETAEKIKRRKINNVTSSNASPTTANVQENDTSEAPSTESNANGSKPLGEFQGNFKHLAVEMPCGHVFGKSCLFEWLKDHSTCPLCRDSIGANSGNNGSQGIEGGDGARQNATSGDNTHQNHLLNFVGTNSGGANILSTTGETNVHSLARFLLPNNIDSNTSTLTPDHNLSRTPSRASSDSQETDNGIFSHILTFLRGSRRPETEPLFPSGVSSRRTESGVETRPTNENHSEEAVLDFMNLGSLFDDNQDNEVTENNRDEANRENNQSNN